MQDKGATKPLDPKQSIRKGFMWIGAGATISQVLDAMSFFVVMLFLTKEEIGIATLAYGFTVFFESFHSMGVGVALLQDNKLTKEETHSVFWFASGFGILAFLISIPLAFPLAWFYNNPALIALMIVSFLRIPISSIGEIPIQLINRKFDFHYISIIQMVGTFTASILKMGLAFLGFGAWSLVLATVSYLLISTVLAFVFSHYRPQWHFKWSECRRFWVFGIKHCLGSALEQLNKNLHYFLIAKFSGEAILGLYRVAYELAMTPALALFRVVNKSSFPIFSRLKGDVEKLTETFMWNQRNISVFAAVPIVFIYFSAIDIFTIQGVPAWFEALPLMGPVLLLAFLRSVSQTYPELYRACGAPTRSLSVAALETAMSFVIFTVILSLRADIVGLQWLLLAWSSSFIVLFGYHYFIARQFVRITPHGVLRSLTYGFGFFALCGLPCWVLTSYRESLPLHPWLHLGGQVVLVGLCLWLYAKMFLGISLKRKVAAV